MEEDGGEGPCIGLAVDVGSSSVRCSAYALRPGGRAVAIPGTMAQVARDALDPATGTADAERVLADVEAVVDGCLGYVRPCLFRSIGRGTAAGVPWRAMGWLDLPSPIASVTRDMNAGRSARKGWPTW